LFGWRRFERIGRLEDARVAQHARTADQQRQVRRADREFADEAIAGGVGLELGEAVGDAVAGQELAQLATARREAGADQSHPASSFDQEGAAGDERGEDQVAESLVA
jgi:hypothetical protein